MLSAFLVCCTHLNALQTRFFMEISFHGNNVMGEQSDLGPYCLQYKLHKNINRLGKQTISGEEKIT